MISMIELHAIVEIYRTKKSDIVPCLATFAFSLWFGLEYGILIGIAINILFTLYQTSRPKITFETEKFNEQEVLIATPDQSLVYSSAEYFQSVLIKKAAIDYPDTKLIVVNGLFINNIDSTVAKVSLIR